MADFSCFCFAASFASSTKSVFKCICANLLSTVCVLKLVVVWASIVASMALSFYGSSPVVLIMSYCCLSLGLAVLSSRVIAVLKHSEELSSSIRRLLIWENLSSAWSALSSNKYWVSTICLSAARSTSFCAGSCPQDCLYYSF